ncbi:S-layer homology domain-containing protein [Paenibacillus rhizoplanae]
MLNLQMYSLMFKVAVGIQIRLFGPIKAKIVNGYDKGKFAPNDAITREQIAVMLHRYAKVKGVDLQAKKLQA